MQTQTNKTTQRKPYNLKKFIEDVSSFNPCGGGLELLKSTAEKHRSVASLLREYVAANDACNSPGFWARCDTEVSRCYDLGLDPQTQSPCRVQDRQNSDLAWLQFTALGGKIGVRADRVRKALKRAGLEYTE